MAKNSPHITRIFEFLNLKYVFIEYNKKLFEHSSNFFSQSLEIKGERHERRSIKT